TRPLEIPRAPRWGLRQGLLSTCEQDDGVFSGPPSAANQSGRRRDALAVRSRLKRIAVADDQKCARRRGERRIRRAAVNHRRGYGRGACASAARPPTEGRADNFSLDINSVTAA